MVKYSRAALARGRPTEHRDDFFTGEEYCRHAHILVGDDALGTGKLVNACGAWLIRGRRQQALRNGPTTA